MLKLFILLFLVVLALDSCAVELPPALPGEPCGVPYWGSGCYEGQVI